MSLSTTIKSIQDIMRKDVGVDGDAQRIGQIVWMLFLKIVDDKELEYELLEDNYKSPIPEELRWSNWALNPEGMTGDELLDFTKGRPTKDVWFYEHPYPPGQKSYSKTRPIRIDEFETEKQWWGVAKGKTKQSARGGRPGEPNLKKRQEYEFAWKVSAEDIAVNGFNLDIKNPHTADTGPGDTDELLKEFARIDTEAASVLDELKQELATALAAENQS